MTLTTREIREPISLFLETNNLSAQSSIVDLFHAVRRIPYGSRGKRTIAAVVHENEGSCSGKHILLREVLKRLKHSAFIETVRGDFASRIPPLDSMPDPLKDMCRAGHVTDFHQYVVWNSPSGEVILDATWSDGPIAEGIPGNKDWTGAGNTTIAMTPDTVLERVEDVPAYKMRLLAGLSQRTLDRRRTFLALLTDWVAKIKFRQEGR